MTHLRIDFDFGATATVESVQLLGATLSADFSVPVAGPIGPVGVVTYITATDFEITDSTKGMILKSPSNSRFRLSVDNDGILTTVKL